MTRGRNLTEVAVSEEKNKSNSWVDVLLSMRELKRDYCIFFSSALSYLRAIVGRARGYCKSVLRGNLFGCVPNALQLPLNVYRGLLDHLGLSGTLAK